MKSSRNFVAFAAKFSAGMQYSQNDFDRRFSGLMHVNRNSSTIIDNCNRIVFVNRDIDLFAKSSQSLVNRVVHDFINQMMQTEFRCASDVHTWTKSNCLESFENLNLLSTVITINRSIFNNFFFSHKNLL